jgi:hypothetical protein
MPFRTMAKAVRIVPRMRAAVEPATNRKERPKLILGLGTARFSLVASFHENAPAGQSVAPGRRSSRGIVLAVTKDRRSPRLFLAVPDAAPHAALFATHLPAALSTAATGHTISWL